MTATRSVTDWIADLGVELIYTNKLPPHRLGAYLDDHRCILIRTGLTAALEQETLHHEYVHALYRDRSSHAAFEWRAWREAAKLIVNPAEYARAEAISDNPHFIAQELGTTTRIVQAFRRAILTGELQLLAA